VTASGNGKWTALSFAEEADHPSHQGSSPSHQHCVARAHQRAQSPRRADLGAQGLQLQTRQRKKGRRRDSDPL
jgi:hypothetical protein